MGLQLARLSPQPPSHQESPPCPGEVSTHTDRCCLTLPSSLWPNSLVTSDTFFCSSDIILLTSLLGDNHLLQGEGYGELLPVVHLLGDRIAGSMNACLSGAHILASPPPPGPMCPRMVKGGALNPQKVSLPEDQVCDTFFKPGLKVRDTGGISWDLSGYGGGRMQLCVQLPDCQPVFMPTDAGHTWSTEKTSCAAPSLDEFLQSYLWSAHTPFQFLSLLL